MAEGIPHSSHWGAFFAQRDSDRISVVSHPDDPDPSPLLQNIPAAARHPSRIARPLVRRGWLEDGPGPDTRRGADEYVALDWPAALDLLAGELARVRERFGAGSIYGGSYGWSSAGRFHHAQSQLHRFLNVCLDGYVRSVNSYSSGAATPLLPGIFAPPETINRTGVLFEELATDTDLVVAFGGIPLRNTAVSGGGNSRHPARDAIAAARARGTEFVLFSPLRDDLPDSAQAQWHPIRPSSDVAVMLALAHTLVSENLHDPGFIENCCTGFAPFAEYLLGRSDGVAKTADWAAGIAEMPAGDIRALARRMASRRTLINVSYALQRARFGEQPVWMGVVLAALLGQIGRPGGGFCVGFGSIGSIGKPAIAATLPSLPQGRNSVGAYIPVARIADMLLNPGDTCSYLGRELVYPDTKLVYWSGGNPFHHHQDLQRLTRAFARPDTIVVHEPYWTATAAHADIVLPATISLERDDIGAGGGDTKMVAMHQVIEPFAESRDEYAIFSDLARRLGRHDAFTEGRSARQWIEHLYETTRASLAARNFPTVDFATFWQAGELELPELRERGQIRAFCADPAGAPLNTPSGRIEIFSQTIADHGYADCPGHPTWMEPAEWLGSPHAATAPLQLVANQPATRLHSQLDFGAHSQAGKIDGREPVRIHPADAGPRGIASGDVVLLSNARGACLAGAVVTDHVRPGVVQLATGAWYEPRELPGIGLVCIRGNPNMLTQDIGTSGLTQGCTGQLCLVRLEKFTGVAPAVGTHAAPAAPPPSERQLRLLAERLPLATQALGSHR